MLRDRFDKLLVLLLLACVAVAAGLLSGAGSQASQRNLAVDKALEQELAYQAKVSYLERLYAPVTELQKAGQKEAALLKLDELARRYPDEAHGELLRGELLLQLGAVPEGVTHLAHAVRMNGDYVDQHSPLSRRPLIEGLLTDKLPQLKQQATANPASPGLQTALKDLYYLQGRMAGGCE